MPREKPSYRDHMEILLNDFGGKRLLKLKDVAKYLGIDTRTAKKRYSFDNNYISIVVLARELS